MDAHAAAADLVAVDDHVVGLGLDLARVSKEQLGVLGQRRREGVVQGHVALVFFGEFEQRKIDDPQRAEDVCRNQVELFGHVHAQGRQRSVGDAGLVRGHHQGGIARFHLETLDQGLLLGFTQELGDRTFEAVGTQLHPDHALGAEVGGEDRQVVEILAAEVGTHAEALDQAAGRQCGVEHLEFGGGHDVADVLEFAAEARVGAVDAVVSHGLVITHDRKGLGQGDADGFCKHGHNQAFGQFHDVVAFDEAHLEVDLGEFGLAVGAQVFVAEALDDLGIAVEARNHQELLEQLGRLRQGVELALADAAGHQVVARALGRALA
ncbi:MAG: hypothetical protein BWY87_00389 [Deltaproteobacteria bacterium ADurb.Bin510]|nr:MAG: hypothetical protein BWY87_00389 [Deltaproteobacteria bacterium ADurb.Bin510]